MLARSCGAEGVRTKRGKLVDKGYLYKLLNNRVYVGEAVHKGTAYPGEHEAIIDRELWDRVHAILAENARTRSAQHPGADAGAAEGADLRADRRAMSPTHTRKGERLYRYYVSQDVLKRGPRGLPGRPRAGRRDRGRGDRPAARLFRQPEIVVGTWRAARAEQDDITEDEVREALLQLDPLWDELFPAEQARIVQLLVERVDVGCRAWTSGCGRRARRTGARSGGQQEGGGMTRATVRRTARRSPSTSR